MYFQIRFFLLVGRWLLEAGYEKRKGVYYCAQNIGFRMLELFIFNICGTFNAFFIQNLDILD